jgi:hypothetical protein
VSLGEDVLAPFRAVDPVEEVREGTMHCGGNERHQDVLDDVANPERLVDVEGASPGGRDVQHHASHAKRVDEGGAAGEAGEKDERNALLDGSPGEAFDDEATGPSGEREADEVARGRPGQHRDAGGAAREDSGDRPHRQ